MQLPRKWQTTKLKHDGQPVLNDSVESADLIYFAAEDWNNSVNFGSVHCKGKGGGQPLISLSLFQHLYMPDVWAASYTVHCTNTILLLESKKYNSDVQ